MGAILRSEPIPRSPSRKKMKVPLNDTDTYSSPEIKSRKRKSSDTASPSNRRKPSKELSLTRKKFKSKEVPDSSQTKSHRRAAATPLPKKTRSSRKKVDNDTLVDIFGSSASGIIKN